MPEQQNFTLHFGVLPARVEDVVPGVDGIETFTAGDRWDSWGDMPREDRYQPPIADQSIHIQVHTSDPWPLIVRIMAVYAPYLRPKGYNGDDWGRVPYILVTHRWAQDEGGYKGMFGIYEGLDEITPDSYLGELNRNQGYSSDPDDLDDLI